MVKSGHPDALLLVEPVEEVREALAAALRAERRVISVDSFEAARRHLAAGRDPALVVVGLGDKLTAERVLRLVLMADITAPTVVYSHGDAQADGRFAVRLRVDAFASTLLSSDVTAAVEQALERDRERAAWGRTGAAASTAAIEKSVRARAERIVSAAGGQHPLLIEILAGRLGGASNEDVADRVGRSKSTIKKILHEHVLAPLDARNVMEAEVLASTPRRTPRRRSRE